MSDKTNYNPFITNLYLNINDIYAILANYVE